MTELAELLAKHWTVAQLRVIVCSGCGFTHLPSSERSFCLTVKGEVMARLIKLSWPRLYSISARNISSKGYIG